MCFKKRQANTHNYTVVYIEDMHGYYSSIATYILSLNGGPWHLLASGKCSTYVCQRAYFIEAIEKTLL